MTPASGAVVAIAGLLAGAVNAMAGGGTLISFPALLGAGLAPVSANVTSSVGLLTGYVGGTQAYRRELAGQGARVRALGAVCMVGGVLGALVLLVTPASAFKLVVPYLILFSCLLLALQPTLSRRVAARRAAATEQPATRGLGLLVPVLVLLCALYGSYFGAGLGVLLLAVLGIFLDDDLQRLNALKGLLSLVVNVVGVLIFVLSGRVNWTAALILLVTAYVGGYAGGKLARRLRPVWLRAGVVTLGVVVAVVLLVRG